MNDDEILPRQTYKTAAHDQAEQATADRFARWAGAKHLKIGDDPPDKQKARIDRVFYRDHVVAFAEIKGCSYAFGSLPKGFTLGLDKIEAGRALAEIVRVPVYIVVHCGCGTTGFFDVRESFTLVENFGRDDRGDSMDRRTGARFQWAQFRVLPDEPTDTEF